MGKQGTEGSWGGKGEQRGDGGKGNGPVAGIFCCIFINGIRTCSGGFPV